jgi:hypothetical protein
LWLRLRRLRLPGCGRGGLRGVGRAAHVAADGLALDGRLRAFAAGDDLREFVGRAVGSALDALLDALLRLGLRRAGGGL